MVSIHLKNTSQNGNLPQIRVKIENIKNRHLVMYVYTHICLGNLNGVRFHLANTQVLYSPTLATPPRGTQAHIPPGAPQWSGCPKQLNDIIILLMEEILQFIGSLSHYLQGALHPRWCRISAINGSSPILSCTHHPIGSMYGMYLPIHLII